MQKKYNVYVIKQMVNAIACTTLWRLPFANFNTFNSGKCLLEKKNRCLEDKWKLLSNFIQRLKKLKNNC